jgi:hypothetical protein
MVFSVISDELRLHFILPYSSVRDAGEKVSLNKPRNNPINLFL